MHGKPDSFPPVCAPAVIHEGPELAKLRSLVDAACTRLAELEAAYTVEKAKVDVMQSRLFNRLRQYHQERERLRLVVYYRRQFLDTLLRLSEEEAQQLEREYHQAKAHSDREYEEAAAAMAAKKELTAEQETELAKLWKRLVKLYHPDRFAHQPDKLETYSKLTAAINRAKDTGDLERVLHFLERKSCTL